MKVTEQEYVLKKEVDGNKSQTYCIIKILDITKIKFSIKPIGSEIPEELSVRIKYYDGINSRVMDTLSIAEFKEKYINNNYSFNVQTNSSGEKLFIELGLMLQEGFVALTIINTNRDFYLPRYSDIADFDVRLCLTIEDPFHGPLPYQK